MSGSSTLGCATCKPATRRWFRRCGHISTVSVMSPPRRSNCMSIPTPCATARAGSRSCYRRRWPIPMCGCYFRWDYALPSDPARRRGRAFVDLGEELLDGYRRMGCPRRPEDVKSMLGERHLGVDDRLAADFAQPCGEGAGLLDRDQRVVAPMQHEKRWRVSGDMRDR